MDGGIADEDGLDCIVVDVVSGVAAVDDVDGVDR